MKNEKEPGSRPRRLREVRQWDAGYPQTDNLRDHARPADDPQTDDPEVAWKLKERELLSRLDSGQYPKIPAERVPHADPPREGGFRMFGPAFSRKLAASALLFAAVWGVFRLDMPELQPVRSTIRAAVTEEWDFSRAAAWYDSRFGSVPSFLPAFRPKTGEAAHVSADIQKSFTAPAHGTITSDYGATRRWVELQTAAGAPVYAMDTGRVLFAGSRADTGYTLVLRHAGGFETTYGYLQPGTWQQNDWIKGGEAIGRASAAPSDTQPARGRVYFSVTKDNLPVNPLEVVRFD